MRKVTADLSILPIGTEETSLSKHLMLVKQMLSQQKEVLYEMGAMSTSLEGDIDQVWDLVRSIQEALFDSGLDRVYTVLKIDDRRDKENSLSSKKESLKR